MAEKSIADLLAKEAGDRVNTLWSEFQLATTTRRLKLSAWYKQYRGISSRKNYEGLADVFVNETLEAIEAIVAQEYASVFSEPKPLMVLPREETDKNNAHLVEGMTIAALDKMSYKQKILRSLRQRGKYGTCFAKVFWSYEEREVFYREKVGDNLSLVNKNKIVKDHPDICYVDELDVAFPLNRGCMDDMDWFVWRKRCSWDYIKARERQMLYSPAQVAKISRVKSKSKNLVAGKDSRLYTTGINASLVEDDDTEILEFWGKVPKHWVEDISLQDPTALDMVQAVIEVVVDGPVLRMERNPYWHQKIPFLMAQYIQVDDEPHGMGVCEIVESLQAELNDKRNQSLDHATEQIAPPLIRNRAAQIDKKQIKLKAFQIIDSNIPGDGGLTPLRLGGNPVEQQVMDGVIKGDIRNISAATNPMQGIGSNKDSTAYEVNALLSRGSLRISLLTSDFCEKFIKPGYQMIFSLLQQYATKEMAVRILGKEGIKWEKVTPEDLLLDYDLIPKISMDTDSRSIMRTQMIQFVREVVPYYPQTKIYTLVRKIYDLFGFEDGEEVVPPPDTEMGQGELNMDEEIQVLTMGQKVDVKYWENHAQKLQILIAFMQQNGRRLKPEAAAAFQDKISQHYVYLQNLEAMSAQLAQQQIAGGKGTTPMKQESGGPVADAAQQSRDTFSGR